MRIIDLIAFWACAIYLCWRGTLALARRNDRCSPPRLARESTEYDESGNRWRPGLLVAGGAVLPEPSDPRPSRGYP